MNVEMRMTLYSAENIDEASVNAFCVPGLIILPALSARNWVIL
jgi:hypothetical protein